MQNLDVFANIRGFAPKEVLELLDQLLLLFPEELKYRLKRVIDSLPLEGDNMQKVLELVRNQWKGIQSHDWVRIAVVGPPQTGKSSLVNDILRKQLKPALPIFSIVDTQGLEESFGFGVQAATKELEQSDVFLLILDGSYGISDSTLQLYERLLSFNKPILVVLNKMDLVENPSETIKTAKKQLGTNVVPTSISSRGSLEKLLKAMVATNAKALYPLAQNFPEFRRTVCNAVVTQSAFSAGVVGAIPIPVSDLLPLTALQTAMILKIARAFGHRLSQERARELLPVLGAGVLVREGSHRLRRRFPEKGALIAVSVAGLWTFALGRAAIRYFETVSHAEPGNATAVGPLLSALVS